jgi:hypothetical protein
MARGNPNPTPPPKDKQFGQPNGNPRHNGAWKKEDTARYKLERMMELPEEELKSVAMDSTRPLFERKLATAIKDGKWKEIESMINQVYGQPNIKQDINHTGNVQFVNDIPRPKSD